LTAVVESNHRYNTGALNVAETFALTASVTLSRFEPGDLALPWPFTVVESNHRYNRPTSRSVRSPKDKSPEDQGFAPINYFNDNSLQSLTHQLETPPLISKKPSAAFKISICALPCGGGLLCVRCR